MNKVAKYLRTVSMRRDIGINWMRQQQQQHHHHHHQQQQQQQEVRDHLQGQGRKVSQDRVNGKGCSQQLDAANAATKCIIHLIDGKLMRKGNYYQF